MDRPLDRLAHLRKKAGFATRRAAADAYGISYETYKKVTQETSGREITEEDAGKVARWHRVTTGWILFGEGTPKGLDQVPLQGLIGAGQEMVEFTNEREETVSTILASPDAVAFEISGDSMLPLAHNGDIVFFGPPVRGKDIRRHMGRECAVTLADGRRFFKVLERGEREDRFDLRSYNAATIRNVEVFEAGPFLGLKRYR